MKKVVIIIVILFGLIMIPLFSSIYHTQSDDISQYSSVNYKPIEGSKEELYQDIFKTLLSPYIDKAVYDYYGQPFTVDPLSNKVINIERPNGAGTTLFVIKLEVIPYYGPHRGVGIDHITLRLDSSNVKVEKFEHIKTF